MTGRLQKNINQLSKHTQEFVRLWREEQRVLQAAAAGGIEAPLTLATLSKAVEGVGETITQTGGLPAAKAVRILTRQEVEIASNLNRPLTQLTPELIALRQNRAKHWVKEFYDDIKGYLDKGQQRPRKDFQISQAASNYQEIQEMLPELFGGTLEGVYISAEELKKGTLALCCDIPALGKKPPAKIQLRLCANPKGQHSHNPGQRAVNFEYKEQVQGGQGELVYAVKNNGHLPIIHTEDFLKISDDIKNLFPVK